MAEVYIDSLTLENFGPSYGEHTLNFRNLEGRCGILIGGKNGAGKTHLLRALYLAVVGEPGVGDLKRVETGADATRFLFEHKLPALECGSLLPLYRRELARACIGSGVAPASKLA